MEQKDYLMRQIEMMTQFLRKLIARMLKKEEDGKADETMEMVKNELQDEFKINPDELIVLHDDDFFCILKEKQFTESHMEDLSQLFMLLGKTGDIEFSLTKRNYLQKALAIYIKLENESHNYSFDRNEKIRQINQMLNGF